MKRMKLFEVKSILRENVAKANAELKDYKEKERKFLRRLIQEQNSSDKKVMEWFNDPESYIGLMNQISDTEIKITGYFGGNKEWRDAVVFTLINDEDF